MLLHAQWCSISDVLFTGRSGVSDFSVLKYYSLNINDPVNIPSECRAFHTVAQYTEASNGHWPAHSVLVQLALGVLQQCHSRKLWDLMTSW